ncbi:MAG: hypothetical protein M1834_003018 [Cirrosporium novae-zelandiae]|nr:MAG: hypothetical protein M1834_003018 [Cirrosporium novae-zelandiae]
MFSFILSLSCLGATASAKTIVNNWDIGWTRASPLHVERSVIGINGQWPNPPIEVDLGDRLVIHITNSLGNQSTGIHWHGIHQDGTNYMDGTTGATQCPIPPGGNYTYDFVINQPGSYWYHSHNMGQYPDGLRGTLIVHDPNAPYLNQIDGEFTVTLSDWYNEEMAPLIHTYESRLNENSNNGLEPIPAGGLINDAQNSTICVEPNKTYLVRVINIASFLGHAFYFHDHWFTVVALDGVYIEETYIGESKNLRIAPGQRVDVLITTKNNTDQNYPILAILDINMFTPPEGYQPNITAYLVYNEEKPLPDQVSLYEFDFWDDSTATPIDHQPLLDPPDHVFTLNTSFESINDIQRAVINNETYLAQSVPTLYTAITVGDEYASNPTVYGQVNPHVVKYGEIVEIILNNMHYNLHPWHLHGHQFQVYERALSHVGPFNGTSGNVSSIPARRDTVMLNENSYARLRFQATNPGIYLFHCHVEWHVVSGLTATFILAPELLSNVSIPKDHIAACEAYGMGYSGNAAGNEGTNMTGANTQVSTYDQGAMYPSTEKFFNKRFEKKPQVQTQNNIQRGFPPSRPFRNRIIRKSI